MEGLFGRIPEEAPDESPASTPPPSPARDAQAAPPAEQALCRVASVVLAKDGVELGRVEDVVPHALIEAGAAKPAAEPGREDEDCLCVRLGAAGLADAAVCAAVERAALDPAAPFWMYWADARAAFAGCAVVSTAPLGDGDAPRRRRSSSSPRRRASVLKGRASIIGDRAWIARERHVYARLFGSDEGDARFAAPGSAAELALRKSRDGLREERDALLRRDAHLREARDALLVELEQAKQGLEALRGDRDAARASVRDMRTARADGARAYEQSIRDERDAAVAERDAARAELETAKEALRAREGRADPGELAALRAERDAAAAERDDALAALAALRGARASADDDADAARRAEAALRQARDDATRDGDVARSAAAALRGERDDALADLDSARREAARLREAARASAGEADAARDAAKASKAKIADQRDVAISRAAELERELAALRMANLVAPETARHAPSNGTAASPYASPRASPYGSPCGRNGANKSRSDWLFESTKEVYNRVLNQEVANRSRNGSLDSS